MNNNQLLLLENKVYLALQQFPEGIKEFDLIHYLREEDAELLPQGQLSDSLTLFQTHFLLFHILYRLRDELRHSKDYELEINALNIQLQPYQDTSQRFFQEIKQILIHHDPLRDYYLNLKNLQETGQDDVEQLLTKFWTKLSSGEERLQALQVLELEDGIDYISIKQQYRRLAMQHHPDRGGDEYQLQIINAAKEVLDRYYR